MLQLEVTNQQFASIKVTRGGRCNAVNRMIEAVCKVEFIAINTDGQALRSKDIRLRLTVDKGLGAGANRDQRVEESRDEIVKYRMI